jgi:hypothetical protein
MVSHPKIAHAKPRAAFEAAQLDLAAAQDELQAAMNHARACDKNEGIAMASLLACMPRPDAETVFRQTIAREQQARYDHVAAGRNADGTEKVVAVGDSSGISQAFAARKKSGYSRRRVCHPRLAPLLFKV